MPALVLLGRKWRVASDDFVFDGIVYICIGLLWAVIFALQIKTFPENCNDPLQIRNFFVVCLVITVSSLAINTAVTWISSRGTIVNGDARQYISLPLYGRFILSVAEMLLAIKGFLVFFKDAATCVPQMSIWVAKGAAITLSLLFLVKSINFCLAYDTLGKPESPSCAADDTSPRIEKAYKIWIERCNLLKLCCIRESNAQGAMKDIARILATFFSEVDLVSSDVLAGLLLLRDKSECLNSDDGTVAQQPSVPSWMTVESAYHYFKFAYGGYGCPLLAMFHPCCWPYHLAKSVRCCLCCLNGGEDDACGFQMGSLQLLTGAKSDEVIHASFRNRVYEVPYFVALDHERRSVVVSIRGSTSLRDLLTDLNAECEPLLCDSAPADSLAHRGILKAAQYVRTRLESNKILDEALQFHPDYDLVLVGHSLGAGVAVLLGLLLRTQYPSIRCFLYAPPGGLLSEEAAKQTEDFVMTVVLGYDCAPRLSLANLETLKSSLIDAIVSCSQPKYKILSRAFWRVLFGGKIGSSGQSEERSPMDSLNHVPQSFLSLCPPGRILHLVSLGNDSGPVVKTFWRKATYFNRILVTPNMLLDHLPPNILRALKAAKDAAEPLRNSSI